jgi:hypothetical protein
MKLTELDNSARKNASRALREQYEVPFNADRMSMNQTRSMLTKVRGLISESKQHPDFYQSQTSPGYMKLVFMEQALADRYNELRSQPTRIVVENEEVEKSQVVLAAQDMVDSTQKMIEEVSDMLVKELPALTTSIQSEIGANESEQFNQQVTEALTSLQAALTQSKGTLQSALNGITGGDMDAGFGSEMGNEMGDEMGDEFDAGMDAGEDLEADDMAADDMGELPPEEPEIPPVGGVGRAKR